MDGCASYRISSTCVTEINIKKEIKRKRGYEDVIGSILELERKINSSPPHTTHIHIARALKSQYLEQD